MARILWLSDAPSKASGFALVTREVCRRLIHLGHEIAILGWWSSVRAQWNGLSVTPCPVDPHEASELIAATLAEIHPDVLVTLGDVPWLSWVASPLVQSALSDHNTKWCIYYPVDGTCPDGGLPRGWADVLSMADLPVTMSAFGAAASARSGIPAAWIPHGCDIDIFRPPPCKDTAKRRLGYDGRFVILSDTRNHRRKLIPRALDIIHRLKGARDGFVFHLHTSAKPQEDAESYRYDVRTDVELLGLKMVYGVREHDSADLSMSELAGLYAAADVHLLTSFGEGFGLPTLQAASAGAVPVVPANSASLGFVGDHGLAVPCDSWTHDEFGLLRGFIDRDRAASVLEMLYANRDLLAARSAAARQFALAFSWDRIVVRWNDCLRRCADRRRSTAVLRGAGALKRHWSEPSGSISTRRPTGHEASVLPIPRIGVPTRLEGTSAHSESRQALTILAAPPYDRSLRILERLFPGTRVLSLDSWSPERDPQHLTEAAVLVVDPTGLIDGIDVACAASGTSYLGKSSFWPKMPGETLLTQARCLLTDYPLAERRLAVARSRAGFGPVAAV
jgi:glycosyltransferase involved in cell wall biosynthesis